MTTTSNKPEAEPTIVLGWRDLEILSRLAEVDGRTKVEEMRWLIRARAFGQLKDLGDDHARPQVNESDLPEHLRVRSLDLGRLRSESGDEDDPAL